MIFNIFSSVSTRKPAAPTTTPAQWMESQARRDQLPQTPIEQPSKLRGAVRSVLRVLHLRRSTPKHPSTQTENHKIVFTSRVPLNTATPSTTASLAPLATISPLFAAQHAGSTTTPTTASSYSTDLITASREKAELEAAVVQLKRQEAHQARVLDKLDDIVSAGIKKFLDQHDAEAEARRAAEERLAAEIASRKRAEEWLLQEQDRRWDAEYEAEKVFRDLEKLKKKKEALEKKIFDLKHRSDFLAPDVLQEALERLGFVTVCDPGRCPLPGACLPMLLEQVYARTVRDSEMAERAATGYWNPDGSEDEECHHQSNSDVCGREPDEPDSVVWYKSGGHRASLFGSDESCWDDFYPPGPSTHRPEPRGTGEDGDYDDELNPGMSPRRPGGRY